MNKTIDFRSDTVTQPTPEMKEAMFNAPLGDDVFGEDPTINELERYAAEMFGMEAAIYCVSGTQTNQIAINIHVQPGGEVITNVDSHVYKYEGGGDCSEFRCFCTFDSWESWSIDCRRREAMDQP